MYEGAVPRSGIKGIFRALHARNFRLFFVGQTISLVGTWMQIVATSWLVYRLTDSAFLLGLVGFMGNLPALFFAPFAGVYADRLNRHKMLIIIQTLAMIQALVMAVLVMSGVVTIWHIIPLSILLGIINAFDMPVRQSFMIEMIDRKEDLSNAIALNSSMVNSSRLIGPSLAGILIALVGEGVCFLINGLSFIAVIASLLAMRITPIQRGDGKEPVWRGLKDGFAYAFGFPPIRSVLLILALVNIVGMPYTVLMPVFARDILHGGPQTMGFLMAAVGVGALVGALYLAGRGSVRGLGKMVPLSAGVFGVGLVMFSLSREFWLSVVLMLVTGLGMMVQFASSNTVLQTVADDAKRGRVMSMYTMAFRGMVPFGSLMAGSLAGAIGAPMTLLAGGASCILGAAIFSRYLPGLKRTTTTSGVFD
jgi:MFS family permease